MHDVHMYIRISHASGMCCVSLIVTYMRMHGHNMYTLYEAQCTCFSSKVSMESHVVVSLLVVELDTIVLVKWTAN